MIRDEEFQALYSFWCQIWRGDDKNDRKNA